MAGRERASLSTFATPVSTTFSSTTEVFNDSFVSGFGARSMLKIDRKRHSLAPLPPYELLTLVYLQHERKAHTPSAIKLRCKRLSRLIGRLRVYPLTALTNQSRVATKDPGTSFLIFYYLPPISAIDIEKRTLKMFKISYFGLVSYFIRAFFMTWKF